MKMFVLASILVAGCATPCVHTAEHAAAMMRYCVQTDSAPVCAVAYESVRHSLSTGVCSAEIVAR